MSYLQLCVSFVDIVQDDSDQEENIMRMVNNLIHYTKPNAEYIEVNDRTLLSPNPRRAKMNKERVSWTAINSSTVNRLLQLMVLLLFWTRKVHRYMLTNPDTDEFTFTLMIGMVDMPDKNNNTTDGELPRLCKDAATNVNEEMNIDSSLVTWCLMIIIKCIADDKPDHLGYVAVSDQLNYVADFIDENNPKRRTFCVWKYGKGTFKLQMIQYV